MTQPTERIAHLAAIVDELRRLLPPPERIPRRAYLLPEVAEMLGVPLKTVRGLIERGELRAKHAGKNLIVSIDEINRFLKT